MTIVPDSPTRIITSIQGNPIDQFIEDAIDGANLTHLIIIPTGCAEQNMRRMTAVVIATHYLDKTNQWDRIELDRRAVAIENIQKGYGNQLTHRSEEGYYGSFSTSNAGTWLTAYVVKVFAMAKSLIDINNDILCSSVKWLILRRQKPDGMFHEDIPISGIYVKGGLEGSTDPDVSMTAFVVISLLESQQYCSNYLNNLQFSINNAVNFIADRYQHLKNPYSVAITSYALALAGRLKDPSKLLSMAKDKSCWHSEESNIVSIEATSYALLSLLKMKAKDALDPVVRWLIEQRFYGETYASTQATMMLYQALAQYQLAKDGQEPQNMDVIFKLPGRRESTKYRINVDSVLRARSEETNINKDFVVKATGRGKATLTVMAVYYEAMIETKKECKDFDLSVTVANETHDARETVSMNICFRYRKNVDATMTIIDVSMMTGFTPDENDLKNLMNPVDKYISYFEINKLAVDKGSLIIYLDRVSHTEEECLTFRLKKDLKVGLVQPGSVTIYEYYSPEMRCHKFYHTEDNNQFIGRICYENVCQCAEGNCLMNQNTEEQSALDRMRIACDAGMDYTYRVSLQDLHYEKDYDRYTMQIKDVFKRGFDEIAVGNSRTFIGHIRCREKLKLKKGEDYIIFGTFRSVWNTKTLDYTYVLGSDTWIEWWPNDRQCQDSEYSELCETFARITEELEVVGCQS